MLVYNTISDLNTISDQASLKFERLNFSESPDLNSRSPAGLNIREILAFQFHFDQGDNS